MCRRIAKSCCILIILMLMAFNAWSVDKPVAKKAAKGKLSAKEILENMADVYSSCESYSDFGKVKMITIQKDGSRETKEMSFQTSFLRPHDFRFELDATENDGTKSHYIVWKSGAKVKTFWELHEKPVENEESLDMALAGPYGISRGASSNVASELLPDQVSGPRLSEMETPQLLPQAGASDTPVYRIKGTVSDSPVTVWIDQESFAIRRVEETQEFESDGSKEETTVLYETPEIDEEVTDEMLAFNPPQ